MRIVPWLAVSLHLLLAATIAFFALLIATLGENRTPAEQSEAERAALMMLAVSALAIAWWICLLLKRWTIAVALFVAEAALALALLPFLLDESDQSDEWVYGLAVVFALTGIAALEGTMPRTNRLALGRNMT